MKYGDEVRVTSILVLGKCYCLCFVAVQLQIATLPSRCDVKSIQFTVCVVYFFVGENVLNTMC